MKNIMTSILIFLFLCIPAQAIEFELTWDAMANAIGYKVCHTYRSVNAITGCPIGSWLCEDVGNVLTYTIIDMPTLGNTVFRIVAYEETQYKAIRSFSKLIRYESDTGNFSTDFGFQMTRK